MGSERERERAVCIAVRSRYFPDFLRNRDASLIRHFAGREKERERKRPSDGTPILVNEWHSLWLV